MLLLAWANLKRRKVRTTVSVLAIMFITLMIVSVFALADGLTDEVAERMSSVQAELIVLPAGANLALLSGEGFGAKWPKALAELQVQVGDTARPLAEAVIPVYIKTTKMGGQDQRVYGIDPAQWRYFGGDRQRIAGELMTDGFDRRIEAERRRDPMGVYYDPRRIAEADLATGRQILIDRRLAGVIDPRLIDGRFGQMPPEQRVQRIREQDFRIVGVVESGVIGRVFMPLATMRHLYAGGEAKCTFFFVKLAPGVDRDLAAQTIEKQLKRPVLVTEQIRQRLRDDLRLMFRVLNGMTGISLIVGLAVIVLTVYTMILERRRELAILKSLGAGVWVILRQVLIESLMLCVPAALLGLTLSYGIAFVVTAVKPLFTVAITPKLWLLAIGGAVGVSVVAALICGIAAARQDAVATLSME
jgi:putative ABC transport system permease protein